MALTHLRLADYSDRELLHVIDETAREQQDGFASSKEVAASLGIEAEYPARSTGVRLGALRRWGMVEKDPERVMAYWRLTPLGETVAFGNPRPATLNAIEGAGAADVVMLARVLGQRHRRLDEGTSRVMQREFRRQWMVNGAS